MRAAVDLAGYTMSQSDELRKVIAKKQKEKLVKHREKFIHGAVERGMTQETAEAIFNDWEEFARYGFNKCLPGNVEVIDAATGRLVRIEDLYRRTAQLDETVTCDTGSLRLQNGRVAHVMENGIKPVFRLITASGRSIEATGNHPFYTLDGWHSLDQLKAGDHLATPRVIPVEGKSQWADHEVVALGHLLAEGNLCHPHSVYFYNQDTTEVEDFVQAAEQFDNVRCTVKLHKGTYSVYAGRIDRQTPPGIFTWAGQLGLLGKTAVEKEIPAAAFILNNRQVGLLISRMWQGDGHIDQHSRALFYATASERMAHQIQHLLLRLGILSSIRTVRFPYKDGRTGYQVFVTGNENLTRFQDLIGCHFCQPAKKLALASLILTRVPAASGTKDIVPIGVKALVRNAKERAGITWEQLNEETGIAQREFYPVNSIGKSGFTSQTIERLAVYFDDPDLRRFAESDIYWDRIVSIEPVGEKMTYDLEVPGTHNFVANDILVHNSHAADYGVISVQTAYLKTHYTVEYMTALLSAEKNDTGKVALYITDCRNMGIDVLPPDVNSSGWDFTIEDRETCEPGRKPAAIRFGLGAIKNVGQGPVDMIIEAHQDGPFTSLNDFMRRVDLRQVGKRSLESLIKVGALDAFGPRRSLLDVLDQIVSVSASHFKAKEAGQLSFFGTFAEAVDDIELPSFPSLDTREQLEWERELIGLYVSDHPLSPYIPALKQKITHFSGQLGEARDKEKVTVAGMVVRFRQHQTKDGKAMGFATLEDIQGPLELVLFPRTWNKFGSELIQDKVLIVEGKVDAGGGDPKILVDRIVEANLEEPAPMETSPYSSYSSSFLDSVGDSSSAAAIPDESTAYSRNMGESVSSIPPISAASTPDDPWGDESLMPPEPDDWHLMEPMSEENFYMPPSAPVIAQMAAEEPDAASLLAIDLPDLPPTPAVVPAPAEEPAQDILHKTDQNDILHGTIQEGTQPSNPEPAAEEQQPEAEPSVELDLPLFNVPPSPYTEDPGTTTRPQTPVRPGELQAPLFLSMPFLVPSPPLADTQKDEKADPRMMTIVLRSTNDKQRDVRRLRRIHGVLRSYPGKDKFSFMVFESGRRFLLEFPNDTTGISSELIRKLIDLVGEGNVSVDTIKIQ